MYPNKTFMTTSSLINLVDSISSLIFPSKYPTMFNIVYSRKPLF